MSPKSITGILIWLGLLSLLPACRLASSNPLPVQVEADSVRRLSLVFGGDIMQHLPQIRAAELIRDSLYDFSPQFAHLKPVLAQYDLALANLELTLSAKAPYSGYPCFKAPDDLALALKDAGFDLLVTANNHSNDNRYTGIRHTLDVLDSYRILHTGTFRDTAERRSLYPLVLDRNNIRIALLNATYGTNGIPTPAPAVVNLIDTAQLKEDIRQARQQSPDFLIAFLHWGLEYQLQENAEQRALAQFLARQGVDCIIGSHPHVVQPIQWILRKLPDAGVDSIPVVYSLGNLISNQQQSQTDGGLLFGLQIEKRPGVPGARIVRTEAIPVWRQIRTDHSGRKVYAVIPLDAADGKPGGGVPEIGEPDMVKMQTFYQGMLPRILSPAYTPLAP